MSDSSLFCAVNRTVFHHQCALFTCMQGVPDKLQHAVEDWSQTLMEMDPSQMNMASPAPPLFPQSHREKICNRLSQYTSLGPPTFPRISSIGSALHPHMCNKKKNTPHSVKPPVKMYYVIAPTKVCKQYNILSIRPGFPAPKMAATHCSCMVACFATC